MKTTAVSVLGTQKDEHSDFQIVCVVSVCRVSATAADASKKLFA